MNQNARWNNEIYVGCRLENPNNFPTFSLKIKYEGESNNIHDTRNFILYDHL